MNYKRIYEYRFRGVDQGKKNIVWGELSRWICRRFMKGAAILLDPAGGMGEFINAAPAREKWVIDIEEEFVKKHVNPGVRIIIGPNLEVPLPENYFNGVFISNFLEHLKSQEEVAELLAKMHSAMAPGGRIVIMGPNFKYGYREYFDFADHTVILTETGVAEHLYGAGFDLVKVIPRFFPLSFRSGGLLPVTPLTVRGYLAIPPAWRILGKQFLVVAEKK